MALQSRTECSEVEFDRLKSVLSNNNVIPMWKKDKDRLGRIRAEGGAYTSASIKREGDIPPLFIVKSQENVDAEIDHNE